MNSPIQVNREGVSIPFLKRTVVNTLELGTMQPLKFGASQDLA